MKIKFDEGLKQLQNLVNELENSSTDLEKSLLIFSEGKALIKTLSEQLNEAETKIVEVIKENEAKDN